MTKMTLLLSIAIASIVALSGCNKSSDGKTAETAGPVDTTQMQNPNIPTQQEATQSTDNDLGTAEDFYRQFFFRTEGLCPNGVPLRTFSAANVIPVLIGRTGPGLNLGLSLNLSIFANGSYQATYREISLVTETFTGGTSTLRADQTRFQTTVTGRWALERNQLILQGLGVGGRFRDNNTDKILLKLNQRFNRSEAVNSLIPLQMVQSLNDTCQTRFPNQAFPSSSGTIIR